MSSQDPKNTKKTEALRPYQFKPGQSGNPSGAPKGYSRLARRIRESTNNGDELLDVLLGIIRRQCPGGATTREVIVATQMLLDRGFGKVPERVQFEDAEDARPIIDVTALSDEQLKKAREVGKMLEAHREDNKAYLNEEDK